MRRSEIGVFNLLDNSEHQTVIHTSHNIQETIFKCHHRSEKNGSENFITLSPAAHAGIHTQALSQSPHYVQPKLSGM